ncbi:probable rhamnogalacturonate lyase B, partial [Coffea eugenioides]|uniref:probable rhamnogalacturonate lyase B n=1 Tax=Coffea eugenioides TaxID=49369 RepID=UPI000F607C9C
YEGVDNALDYSQRESRRGYWDIVWQRPGQADIFTIIEGTSFKVMAQNENQIEVSFKMIYDAAHDQSGSALPLNIDKRFVMLRGQPGFYSYAIFERSNGWPGVDISELRIALKLDHRRFNYMAVADNIQRVMPTASDRTNGQPLAYPEAVFLTNPTNLTFKGQVDDKYEYSKDNKDNHVHGWITSDSQVGFWMIIPSYEFKTGGPIKRELTSHVGPTTLAAFHSRHYAGATLKGLKFVDGEPWKKVFGPVFVYLNSNSDSPTSFSLWEDAKHQSVKEARKWPYDFPASDDYPHATQRATVRGHLKVHDRYLERSPFPAKSAYVGLAPPGAPGSWQLNAKGYQFWTQTDDCGHFTIRGIRPGKYNLYAWVPGIMGDYKSDLDINLRPGEYKLGEFVFTPPRNGPTIWEIGIPDRTAAEFYVPDGNPRLENPLFINHPEKYRQYGLWERYTDLYPDHDLVFRVGVSDYRKDWFFAHVTRRSEDNSRLPTTWQISFDLRQVLPKAIYTLQLALASSAGAEVQVRVNDPNASSPQFSTGLIGKDNAIARHGIHGLYQLFSVNIPGNRLVSGTNTIFLRQSRGGYIFSGVMYDYLRLEGPAV